MSFLNPVNEPVLRFKSTDAGAPQINYAARTAGDVKAVLKACLVTGYGAVESAGWSIVNEVAHVAEFISPSTAMSDYRIKINDSSSSAAVWSYLYQETAENLGTVGQVSKNPSSDATKTHASNGWELLITAQGFVFIDKLYVAKVSGITCHYTYIGQVKSALINNSDTRNIMFFTFGALDTENNFLRDIFNNDTSNHYRVGSLNALSWSHAAAPIVGSYGNSLNLSPVNITGDIYLIRKVLLAANQYTTDFVAQIPCIALQSLSYDDKSFSTVDATSGNRSVLSTRPGRTSSTISDNYYQATRARIMLYTDYWEY